MSVGYPLINGVRHSWASVEIKIAGNTILGITKVDYSDKLDPGKVRGAGARVIAFTTGTADTAGSFTILLEEFNQMIASLQTINPRWKLAMFDTIITYAEEDSGLTTIVDTLQGCRISETKIGTTEAGNSDPSLRECTIEFLDLLWNGQSSLPEQPVVI